MSLYQVDKLLFALFNELELAKKIQAGIRMTNAATQAGSDPADLDHLIRYTPFSASVISNHLQSG